MCVECIVGIYIIVRLSIAICECLAALCDTIQREKLE